MLREIVLSLKGGRGDGLGAGDALGEDAPGDFLGDGDFGGRCGSGFRGTYQPPAILFAVEMPGTAAVAGDVDFNLRASGGRGVAIGMR